MAATFPESHLDLLTQPLTATLSTVGKDGLPQVTALWYLFENNELKLTLNGSRQKFKNVAARPQATLFILDPANPQRTIEVRANLSITPDPDLSFTDRVIAHYGNPFNVRDLDGPDGKRYEIVLNPVKVNTLG